MNPGVLDRKIEIKQAQITRDSFGGEKKIWVTFHTPRSRVIYNKGGEKVDAGKETGISSVIFRIRFYDGITQSMTIEFQNETYNIKSINNIGRRAYIDLFAEKRV